MNDLTHDLPTPEDVALQVWAALGLDPAHARRGRAAAATEAGRPYVTIVNSVCPKYEGEAVLPFVLLDTETALPVSPAETIRVGIVRFANAIRGYGEEVGADRIEDLVWRDVPEVSFMDVVVAGKWVPGIRIRARFCFEPAP